MIKLSDWEALLITFGISYLTNLETKVKNPTALAGLKGAVTFLKELVAGTVSLT